MRCRGPGVCYGSRAEIFLGSLLLLRNVCVCVCVCEGGGGVWPRLGLNEVPWFLGVGVGG